MTRITLIQGHPDADPQRFCRVLAAAYAHGAREGGHELREIDVARLDFPLLRSRAQWTSPLPPPGLHDAQEAIAWAEHLVIVYPLWLGDMPALLKGFLEQVARPGFALPPEGAPPAERKRKYLAGKSARVVVTMGMPALFYRLVFRAHSVKALERNILGFVGIAPVRESLIGMVESPNPRRRQRWLERLREDGRAAR